MLQSLYNLHIIPCKFIEFTRHFPVYEEYPKITATHPKNQAACQINLFPPWIPHNINLWIIAVKPIVHELTTTVLISSDLIPRSLLRKRICSRLRVWVNISIKSHNVSALLYHIVCPTKYRRVIFDAGIDEYLREICIGISERYEIRFVEIGVDKDHVHILVQTVPMYSPTKLVKTIKKA